MDTPRKNARKHRPVVVHKPDSTRYPCIFAGKEVRPTDDQIQDAWRRRFGIGAPFGSLRKEWRREHCRTINPYGSEGCPFTREQCITAFREAVLESLDPKVLDPRVYFISVAKTRGMQRAENKPREEDRIASEASAGPGLVGVVGEGRGARRAGDLGADPAWGLVRQVDQADSRHLRTRLSRPIRIGELLRPPDGGARERQPDDGPESAE